MIRIFALAISLLLGGCAYHSPASRLLFTAPAPSPAPLSSSAK